MGLATAAIVGGTLAAGALSASAASSGAKKQANAVQESAAQSDATQRYMYDQTRQDLEPWRASGREALLNYLVPLANQSDPDTTYRKISEGFTASPDYQFRLGQGLSAVEGSAAARGGLLSGNTLRAVSDYGQQSASQEFGNYWNRYTGLQDAQWNRLASIAGVGQTATNTTAAAGTAAANAQSQTATSAGNALSSIYGTQTQGVQNALTGTTNSLYGLAGYKGWI